jgi:hypothetical protein
LNKEYNILQSNCLNVILTAVCPTTPSQVLLGGNTKTDKLRNNEEMEISLELKLLMKDCDISSLILNML